MSAERREYGLRADQLGKGYEEALGSRICSGWATHRPREATKEGAQFQSRKSSERYYPLPGESKVENPECSAPP